MNCLTLIFSRNRAFQLDGAIRSFLLHAKSSEKSDICILYSADSPLHTEQYSKLAEDFADFPFIRFVPEQNFYRDVIALLATHDFVLFLVDDNIFVRDFSLSGLIEILQINPAALGFSLRLGKNTTYCYRLNSAQQLPEFTPVANNILSFDWTKSEHDFGYPLELSSSIYRTDDILFFIATLPFFNPNSLEALINENIARFRSTKSLLLCFETSATFRAPMNKAICANQEFFLENFAQMFANGKRLDIEKYFEFVPNACHQEVKLYVKESAKKPLVSVIIRCYNQAEFLPDVLESIARQTFTDWECIVNDDGSPDDTADIFEQFKQKYPDKKFDLLRTPNGGLSTALNVGIEASHGKYILPLDADDKIEPEYLAETVRILEENPQFSIVYVDEQNFGNATHVHSKGDSTLRNQLFANVHDYCSLFRREVWETVGGYSPAMYLGGEDWNFWISAAKHNFVSYHLKKPLFFYRNRENTMVSVVKYSMEEVQAYIVLHHPELYTAEGVRIAESIVRNTAPNNLKKLEEVLKKHPKNALLNRMFELASGGKLHRENDSLNEFNPAIGTKSKKSSLISVIVPTHNRPRMLLESLKSIVNQTIDNWEIIVVNDAGEDVSEVVASLNNPKIRLITHEKNKGMSGARNTGIRAAKGKYIAYLDDDDIFYPEHLQTLVEFLESTDEKVAYSDAYRAFQEKSGEDYIITKRDIPNSKDFNPLKIFVGNVAPILCFMHEKSCVDAVGLFDETLTSHEDWEFWIRLSKKHSFKHIPKLTCEFRWREDGSSVTTGRRADMLRTAEIIHDRHSELELLPEIAQARYEHLEYFRQELFSKRTDTVSIVIPTFNNVDLTRQCIEAIRQTADLIPYEIIVVDNASSDSTPDYLRGEEASGRIKLIVNPTNLSFSKANNQASKLARGNYLLFLNNDTIPHNGWLSALISLAESDAEIGILGSKLLYADGTIQHAGVAVGILEGEPFPYHIYLCQPPNAPFVNKQREFQMVTGACLSIRRALFERLGGFDENYVNGHEDLDLCLKVRELGFKVIYCPTSEVTHLESGTKRLIGLENFHYKKGVENEEGRGRKRFLERWANSMKIDDDEIYSADGVQVAANKPEQKTEGTHTKSIISDHFSLDKTKETAFNFAQNDTILPNKSLHILFTMYGWADEGGGTILPRQIAKALVRRGNRVTVIFTPPQTKFKKPAYFVEKSEDDGVQLFGIYNRSAVFFDLENPDREINDPQMRQVVSDLIQQIQPDIVHYHSLLNFSFRTVEDIAKLGFSSVFTSHNYYPICPRMYLFKEDLSLCNGPEFDAGNCALCVHQPQKQAALSARAETGCEIFRDSIDRHLAVSNRVRDLYIQNGHPAEKIIVLHQQPESVDWSWNEIGAMRRIEIALNRPLKIGFIGSLLPQKGAHILVGAMQAFTRLHMEAHIFGAGHEQYISAMRSLDTKQIVQFHGRYEPEQLPEILRSVDVVVVPSVWEDCAPLVVAEALAARCPVVGSRIGGIPDFIEDGKTGLLFKPNNPMDLAQKLTQFLTNETLLGKMQTAIVKPLGFLAYLDELLRHYFDVLVIRQNTKEPDARTKSKKTEQSKDYPVQKLSEILSQKEQIPTEKYTSNQTPQINLIWEGSQFVTHSLALVNREQCVNVIESGVAEVTILPYEFDTFSPAGNPKFELLQKHDIRFKPETSAEIKRLPHVWVRHQWPPQFEPPRGAKWVIMQPWEFSTCRKDFIEGFKMADEIWTPSNYSRNVFVRGGVDFNKVQVVPNGIDPHKFTPIGDKFELKTSKKFKFLFVGGTIFRKGIDVLLEAYSQAFSSQDDVCLVIKDLGGDTFYKGQTAEKTIADFRKNSSAPEIIYINNILTEDEMTSLYRACNVFVSPYRGEGFSIPTLEAMATALPVIVTAGGATDDFVDESVGWLISASQRFIGPNIDGHELTGDAYLLEPSRDDLIESMKFAYNNSSMAATKGIAGCLRARTQWTWKHATLKMLSRLDSICGTTMAKSAEDSLRETDDSLIVFCRAEAAFLSDDFDAAIELYTSAIKMQNLPEKFELLILHRLAWISLLDGNTEMAENFLAKVSGSNPDKEYLEALIKSQKGDWDGALDSLEPLLLNWKEIRFEMLLGVSLENLLCDIAGVLIELGGIEQALEFYTKVLELNHSNAEACYGAGVCLAKLGEEESSHDMLEWALKIDPNYEPAKELLEK